ncbi:uncharacterized protein LOC120450126 [Drosophila santomea]|uniref:uncharacterized protein LOC120450126 n=1 Tax=Drosophila santomea TaxID=129105 RepID=UPI001952E761|nr:uncharacterized protein LOC120450126 [Drosophila santomea]
MPVRSKLQPIRKRRMTTGGANPLPAHVAEKIKQRNFYENIDNIGNQVQIRRPANSQMFVDRSNSRDWNDSNSRGGLTPPPPENLNWGSSFGRSLSQDLFNESNTRMPNDNFQQESPNPSGFRTMEDSYYRTVQAAQPRMDMERSINEYQSQSQSQIGNTHPRMNMDRNNYELQFGNSHARMNMDHNNYEAQYGNSQMNLDHNNCETQFGNSHPRMNLDRNNCEPQFVNKPTRMNMDRDEGFNTSGYRRFELDILEPPSQFKNARAEFECRGLSHDDNKHAEREPVARSPHILDKMFTIGGFKMPYVTYLVNEPYASDMRSYAVRFFKKSPDYIIRQNKSEVPLVQHIYNDMIDITELSDDMEGRLHTRFRDSLSLEWTKIYRGRNYRSWEGWWKDFRNIDVDIYEQLKNFDCFNVKYNFMMPAGDAAASKLIKLVTIALEKNRNDYLGNMKIVYAMMDRHVLGNLSMEATAQLQDIIRSVPNHLWIFKLRCMVYVWYNYSQVMKSKDTGDKKYQMVLKQWKSPVIHWIAKQAFFELKNISKSEFPQYRELYGAASKAVKKT